MRALVKSLFLNFSLITAFSAIVINQIIKVLVYWYKEKEFKPRHIWEAGGMPSSHTAMVCALSTMVGLTYGFSSILFAVVVAFSLIVMHDAIGVRRATGKQALILNKIVEDIYKTGKVNHEKLQGLMGHSPVEVLCGAILGIGIALVMYWIFYLH